ncbi:hypothetical protein ABZT47_39605 [Sphaerisporangium sp. NPDC005289]|uniref:hypothetical protein n=1 Tax=Sphaerisporangium sp. NPDC005289 TaxID=3155247 RepID=UPI0033BEB47E
MWDYDSLIGKAQRYFLRAEQANSESERDVMAIWLLLGLEFLVRAGLAHTNPALNSDPQSMIDAVLGKENLKAKTIPVSQAIDRLNQLIPPTPESIFKAPANNLINLRNAELHSGMAALDIDVNAWLPAFTRVTDVVCKHIGLDADNIVGRGITTWGRSLIDQADQAVQKEIRERIKAAKDLLAQMRGEERAKREAALFSATLAGALKVGSFWDGPIIDGLSGIRLGPFLFVECPACTNNIPMDIVEVRRSADRLDGDFVHSDAVFIASSLHCPVCELTLTGASEISAAGLSPQHIEEFVEELSDRFTGDEDYDGGLEYGDE